ncbi:TPA: sulfatase-like hydrolase/transferase, partial [Citrobacter freundii]|nr:sulfatase-like hydrolase/transferase [Citrobacter freundii]
DYQLGLFINDLKASGVLDNTIVVITADHATFPTPEFNSSFGTNAKYFIDTIPLLIIGGNGGRIIDAMGSNSLSLTPTILQLLNVNNTPNFFLGCSLLDVICKSRFSNISAIGKSFFKTDAEEYPDYNVQELNKSDEILSFYNISG